MNEKFPSQKNLIFLSKNPLRMIAAKWFYARKALHIMIVADVTFYPIGKGISVGPVIKQAIDILRANRVKCYPNSMATVIEADTIKELFSAIENAESFITSLGFQRVETIVRIDHRTDLENSVKRKIDAVS